MRERRTAVLVTLVVALGTVASSQLAWATFNDTATASTTYATDVLLPPTGAAAGAGTCTALVGDQIVLTWTATSSTWADGYEIARSLTPGGPFSVIGTVSGTGTTTYTDGPLVFSTTYYYAIRSTRYSWQSTGATASRTTRSSLCV